ncbi:hypothetical protein CDEF62S_01207 [Castellaniella defragrans]
MHSKHGFYVFSVILQLICWAAMVWPGALIANRIQPFVLGLPFMFFWYVAWVFIMFLGLVALYLVEYAQGGR